MNLLLIHPSFPGQFQHLARAFAAQGDWTIVGVGCGPRDPAVTEGVTYRFYTQPTGAPELLFPPVQAFGEQVRRGRTVADLLLDLRRDGFEPDVVLAHPGWGDALFVQDVFPRARSIAYLEYFYRAFGSDLDFDPEFPPPPTDHRFVSLRNSVNLHAFAAASVSITPTVWQASLFPPALRAGLTVLHDGIDTQALGPRTGAAFPLPDGRVLTADDEVVTYVARSLEPYRGFHGLMRSLPELLRRRPKAHVVLAGAEPVSYGRSSRQGGSWTSVLLEEVGDGIDRARVHFVGALGYRRYLDLLSVSRVHVYLTYPFVLSWSLLEAMACGCAVVGSDTAPVREVIEDGANGRLVGFFDRDTLVARVCELLDDAPQRARLGRAARETIVERFDFETRILPRYRDLMAGGL
jgi:glycosyltransferase involved in cell wall biosynthesis